MYMYIHVHIFLRFVFYTVHVYVRVHVVPTLPVTPAQLMRPGIGQNVSCTMSDWLTSRPDGCSQPRELWFSHILMYNAVCFLFFMKFSP